MSQSFQQIKTNQFSQIVQPINLASLASPASPISKFSHLTSPDCQSSPPAHQDQPVLSTSPNSPSCQSRYSNQQVIPVQLQLTSASPVSPWSNCQNLEGFQPEPGIAPTVPSHTSHNLLAGILTMIRRPEYYHLYDVRSRKNPATGLLVPIKYLFFQKNLKVLRMA